MIDNDKDVKPNAEATSSPALSTEDDQSVVTDSENSQASTDDSEHQEGGDTKEEREESSVDYVAELQRLRESRDREKTIAREERRKRKEAEKQAEHVEDDKDPDDIDARVEARLEAMRREQADDMVEEELDQITENESERALIREIYDHRISGKKFNRRSIRQDLEDAKFLANKPRFKSQLFVEAKKKAKEELRREQTAINSSGGSSTRREPKGYGQSLNAEERKLLDFAKKAAARGR